MKSSFLLFILFLISLHSFGQNPKNLSECNAYFDKNLKPKDIRYIKKLSVDELGSLHMDLGMSIRNSWIHGNRSPELVDYFHSIEIYHPDDISSIIIKNYWHYLKKKPFDISAEITHFHEYWRKSREIGEKMQKETDEIEKKFSDNYLDIKYNNSNSFTLRLPDYKNDSNVFSNEFIKYKNGYLINSLTTTPREKKRINYRYYYIDLKTNQLFNLQFKSFDSVQSIITINSTLYIAGKKNNKLKIVAQTDGKVVPLNLSIAEQKGEKLQNQWVKLGIYKDTLFALQPNGVLFYNGKDWNFKHHFDFENYFKKNYRASQWIPTENIRITSKKMYFLQEVLQMRDCDLFEFDFEKNTLSEFWEKHKLADGYKQEISTYTTINDSNLFVASERAGQTILLSEKDTNYGIYLLDGKVKSDTINNLKIRKVITKDDSLFLIAEDGLFNLKNNEITRLVTFENTVQTIDDGKYKYHFEFRPRSCEMIDEDEYLIGGMFGGLFRVNLKHKTIVCLDDYIFPLQTMEILGLEK